MSVRFIVDERSLDLNGIDVPTALEVIETILDRVDDARHDGHGVCYGEELFTMPLLAHRSFWDLCDPLSPVRLTPELSERAAAAFGTLSRWDELDAPWPPEFEVSVQGGAIETTPSVAWSHAQADLQLSAVACICSSTHRPRGLVQVELSGRISDVWFVEKAHDVENYFRWLIAQFAKTPHEIEELAPHAFKHLKFVLGCFNGIKKMSKQCRQLAPEIVKHLAAFSDEGRRIFEGPWQKAPSEFGHFGVEVSDENGNTKSNRRAAKERLINVDGEDLFFWWHSKIEPHQNRIHICPDKVPQGGEIIVGIFCQHLTV